MVFFIYRYNTTKTQYDGYVKRVDSKLKQKYHISLDELLTSNNLTDELLREREIFYNRCPVDMSPGTVNRIAWAVDRKFNDFNCLPQVKFDKELIKSGVEYSNTDFYRVRDVYNEYKASIVNLVKKTKTDEVNEEEDGAADKSIIDLIFKGKFYEACPNGKTLCDILIDLLYDKPNAKGVVWDMCGNVIIDNLLDKANYTVVYPEAVVDNEEFSCCRKKFKMKSVYVGSGCDGEV